MEGQSAHRSRAAEMATIYEQKRAVTEKVRLQMAQYGDEVVAIVLAFALQPKRMPVLFTKLNLKFVHDTDAQLGALKCYLGQRGRFWFLKRLKTETKKVVDATNIDDICKGMEGASEAARDNAPASLASEIVKAANFQGAERRVIPDRRVSPDRRNDVAAIRKNNRFGGERRKIKRRKTD